MTVFGDNTDWVLLTTTTHTLYLKCEEWEHSISDKVIMMDFPNSGHYGFSLNTEKVVVKLKNVFVISIADWQGANGIKTGLKTIRSSGEEITLKIKINNTGDYEEWDGSTNISMPVVISNVRGYTKKVRGDGTYFIIKSIEMIQSGALTT